MACKRASWWVLWIVAVCVGLLACKSTSKSTARDRDGSVGEGGEAGTDPTSVTTNGETGGGSGGALSGGTGGSESGGAGGTEVDAGGGGGTPSSGGSDASGGTGDPGEVCAWDESNWDACVWAE